VGVFHQTGPRRSRYSIKVGARLLPVPFVSLGRDCEVSFQLRRSGHWVLPSPFDHALTPFAALRPALAGELERVADWRSWTFDGRVLVHRDLPLSVPHLRFAGPAGAILACLRLGVASRVFCHLRWFGISPIFFRLADGPAEVAESEALLHLLSSLCAYPRLVHVQRTASGREWVEHGELLVHAKVFPSGNWRGDRASWSRLLARVGAWSGARLLTPSVAAASVFAMGAPLAWGEEWAPLLARLEWERVRMGRATIDPLLVATLIAAEDHRFFRHSGIDFGRTLRAALAWVLDRRAGGGSTVEQQLVRVLTGRMERTLGRKLREILAAAAVGRVLSKREVAAAYLLNGYFGRGRVGIRRAAQAQGFDYAECTAEETAQVISCLKYPCSPDEAPRWTARRKERARWIASRLGVAGA
jgi:hypothetical protein